MTQVAPPAPRFPRATTTMSTHRMERVSELVKRAVGFEGEIIWDRSKPDGTPRKLMDSSKIFEMGWKPQVELEEGVKMAYEDFLRGKAL